MNLFDWPRGPRSNHTLNADKGVYALFLCKGATLPEIEKIEDNLLYIGLAGSKKGLKGRCHFNARTKNHSPRKSLAVLLMDELTLKPVLISKPNSTDTWGLDASSDMVLTEWMHNNLELAFIVCDKVGELEKRLIVQYAPPLNLKLCKQNEQHNRISTKRRKVMDGFKNITAP